MGTDSVKGGLPVADHRKPLPHLQSLWGRWERLSHPITVMHNGNYFFHRYGIAESDLQRYLAAALSAGGEYADLYFEYHTTTSIAGGRIDGEVGDAGHLRRLRRARHLPASAPATPTPTTLRRKRSCTPRAPRRSSPAVRPRTPVVSLKENRGARSLSRGAALGRLRRSRKARSGDARRPCRARLRSAHQGSSRQLRRRAAPHSDHRLRRHLCRRFAAAGAHERVLPSPADDGQSLAGTSGGGGRVALEFFPTEKTPEHFAERSGAPGHHSARRARMLPPARWKWCSVPAGPASCCTKPSATAWKPTSTARGTSAFSGLLGTPRGQRQVHGGRQRHHAQPPRLAQRGRRRQRHAEHRADRERHPEGLPERQALGAA